MIDLRAVSAHYASSPGLQEVTFSVAPGEFVLVSGPSGCGKSTLARLLAGLIPQAIPANVHGEAWVNGMDPIHNPPARMAPHIGLVFQNPATQLFCLTVEEEVGFGPRNLGLSDGEVRVRVSWALQAVGLSDLRQRAPVELSGGQQQRLAIAATLAMSPPLLVLDEPLASLDVPGVRQVLHTLTELNQRHGVTVVLIEHRLVEAARRVGRLVLMEAGRIVADGPTEAVLCDRTLLRRLGIRRPTDGPPTDWVQLLHPSDRPSNGVKPLIELRQATAGYNGQPVIHAVDLRLYPGEFVALVGDNGAGKSTLARVLAGLLRPSRGTVRCLGQRRARPGLDVGMLFQNPLDQLLTDRVDDELAFGPRNWNVFHVECHQETLAAADLVSLRNRAPLALSAGQQQRTALAASLALRPRLLIMDEPTLGQDWGHLEQVMDFVAHLNRQGSTILLITHDYKLAHRYARRVLLMREGRLVADGRLDAEPALTNPEGQRERS